MAKNKRIWWSVYEILKELFPDLYPYLDYGKQRSR